MCRTLSRPPRREASSVVDTSAVPQGEEPRKRHRLARSLRGTTAVLEQDELGGYMNRVQVKPGKRNSVSEDPAGHSSRHCSRGTYDAIFRLTPASVAEKSFSLAFLIAEFLTNDADRERKDLSFGATSDRASGVVAAVPTPLLVSIDGPVAANTFCAALQNAC